MGQMKMKTYPLQKSCKIYQMKILMKAKLIRVQRVKNKRLHQLKLNKFLQMMLTRLWRKVMTMMVLRRNRTIRRKTPRNLQV